MIASTNLQRRLAAILFADVAGFSRLMEADEHTTVQRLRERREEFQRKVEEHGGRIIDTAGDSILAEFVSVLQAVQAAMAVQAALGSGSENAQDSMVFRIGVNLGEILGSDDGTIYGDAVNIAARVQALAKAGGICVSGIVHDQVSGKMELTFEDLGKHLVKNIAEPIRIFRILMPDEVRPRTEPGPSTQSKLKQPSIAVLPFSNMSGDPEQEYFSDGITDDIITDLSKIAGLFVIARHSSFIYKGKSVSIPEVARDLGVRYVLEGSVRRAGGRVRVTAQLIDGADGGHVWAERYDRELNDIFVVQDDVTQNIVGMLKVKLTQDELRHVMEVGTKNIEAYDLCLRGNASMLTLTPKGIQLALDLYERACDIDPNYAEPHANIARCYVYAWATGLSSDRARTLDIAVLEAKRAVKLDPKLPIAQAMLGWASLWAGDHSQAIAAGERAVRLAPNDADILTWHAMCLSWSASTSEAENLLEKAFRLNPHVPALYYLARGVNYFVMEAYDRAIEMLRAGTTKFTTYIPCYIFLTAALALSGGIEEAAKVKDDLYKLSPDFNLRGAKRLAEWKYPADADRLNRGLRLAEIV